MADRRAQEVDGGAGAFAWSTRSISPPIAAGNMAQKGADPRPENSTTRTLASGPFCLPRASVSSEPTTDLPPH
jgi:hypothetical protein